MKLKVIIEKGTDGYFVVHCPSLKSCWSQGKTKEEALKNIREVIDLCLEEKENRTTLKNFHSKELIFSTLSYA